MGERIHEKANEGLTEVDAVVSPDGIAITLTAGDDIASVNLELDAALRLGEWLVAQVKAKIMVHPDCFVDPQPASHPPTGSRM